MNRKTIRLGSTAKVRILIACDHAVLQGGIRTLLGVYDEFEVVGEASGGAELVEKAQKLMPDVILTEMFMPVPDGKEATRRIRRAMPKAKVLVLGQHETKEDFLSAIRAGAAGYVAKRAWGVELVPAIRAVTNGGCYLSAPAAKALVESCRRGIRMEPFDRLTARQREILKLIVEGHTSRNISNMIDISLRTVEGHRLKLMKRLGTRNQTELIGYALRKGLVPLGS